MDDQTIDKATPAGSGAASPAEHHLDWASKFCKIDPRGKAGPSRDGGETPTGDGVAGPGSPQDMSADSSLVDNAVVQALAKKMEDDGDAADTQWKSQTTDDVFNSLSPSIRTEYDADGSACDQAKDAFNEAWTKLFLKQGSPEKLLAAWNVFSLRIAALQLSNARIKEFMTIKAAEQLATFGSFVSELSKEVLARDLASKLEALRKAVVGARTQLHKAEAKLALNAALTAITTIAAPEATLAKVALGVGGFVGHIVINSGLGSGSADGSVVVQVGSDVKPVAGIAGLFLSEVKVYGVTGKQGFGSLRGAIDLALDGLEISEDIQILTRLKTEAAATETEFNRIMAGLTPLATRFQEQEAVLTKLNELVAQAVKNANSALQDYTELQREIQKAIKSGS